MEFPPCQQGLEMILLIILLVADRRIYTASNHPYIIFGAHNVSTKPLLFGGHGFCKYNGSFHLALTMIASIVGCKDAF